MHEKIVIFASGQTDSDELCRERKRIFKLFYWKPHSNIELLQLVYVLAYQNENYVVLRLFVVNTPALDCKLPTFLGATTKLRLNKMNKMQNYQKWIKHKLCKWVNFRFSVINFNNKIVHIQKFYVQIFFFVFCWMQMVSVQTQRVVYLFKIDGVFIYFIGF